MKKIKILAMMLCIVAVGLSASCSKDDNNESADITGYWKCTHSVWHYICISHGEIKDDITKTDSFVGKTWQFTKDGKLYVEGEKMAGYVACDGYVVLDKKDDLLVKKYKIDKVTDKTLILSHVHEGDVNYDGDDEFAQNVLLEFERI